MPADHLPDQLAVTVLGCSGTYAAPGNACSGYLIRTGTTTVWLDAGPGTLANLQEHVPLDEVDAVVLSHEHPDHWLELPLFRNALEYGHLRRRVPVYGTAGNQELADLVVRGRLEPIVDWRRITGGDEVVIGDVSFRFARTDHPVETLAVRMEHGGRVAAYTADTGPRFTLADLDGDGGGFDLAFCDATFTTEQATASGGEAVHLSAAQAGAMAESAGVRRLVVTHFWPGCDAEDQRDEAAEWFGGPVEAAAVHRTFDV